MLLAPTIGGNRLSGQPEKSMGYIFFIYLPVRGKGIQVAMDLLHDPVILKQGPCDKKGILKIDLILFVIVMVCKFCISSQGKASCSL